MRQACSQRDTWRTHPLRCFPDLIELWELQNLCPMHNSGPTTNYHFALAFGGRGSKLRKAPRLLPPLTCVLICVLMYGIQCRLLIGGMQCSNNFVHGKSLLRKVFLVCIYIYTIHNIDVLPFLVKSSFSLSPSPRPHYFIKPWVIIFHYWFDTGTSNMGPTFWYGRTPYASLGLRILRPHWVLTCLT